MSCTMALISGSSSYLLAFIPSWPLNLLTKMYGLKIDTCLDITFRAEPLEQNYNKEPEVLVSLCKGGKGCSTSPTTHTNIRARTRIHTQTASLMRGFTLLNSSLANSPTDQRTDGWTDRPTDEKIPNKSCVSWLYAPAMPFPFATRL